MESAFFQRLKPHLPIFFADGEKNEIPSLQKAGGSAKFSTMKKYLWIWVAVLALSIVTALNWWIIGRRPVVSPAGDAMAAENAALREKLAARERAYFDCRDQLARYRLALGGAMDSDGGAPPPHREEQLLALLKEIIAKIEAVDKLRLEEAGPEQVEPVWRKLLDLIRNPGSGTPSVCRVLAVDPESGLVVLSAGTIHGVFPGLLYRVADSDTQLRVIECRPWVSGATVYRGDLGAVTEGRECRISETPAGGGNRILPENF